MKRIIIFIGILCLGQVYAQNFEDDFSDGDFSSNPTWSGADSNFVVFDFDGNYVLRLNDDEAATSYLSSPSTEITGFWEFFIRIDGTSPSGSNKAEVILMSDLADLSGPFNGYGIRVGQTGEDVFHLVRYDAGIEAEIVLSDTTVFQAGGGYRLKVSRDISGNWALEIGEGYLGELKNSGQNATDNTYTSASFLGVKATYTSSRTDDFYFDFKIEEPAVIVEPFYVESMWQSGASRVTITFNRGVDPASISPSGFTLNESLQPQTVDTKAADSLVLVFRKDFLGGENQLAISGIESSNNDTVLTDTTILFFVFDAPESGDILINEFLKDPATGSGLSEYIELVNTSGKTVNLRDWHIGDNSALRAISDSNFVLLPDTFLVLTSNPEALVSTFGEGNYLDVSLPALNNTTDQIRLISGDGILIDSLEYTPDWGGVDVALERRSETVHSSIQANWGDSPAQFGGTPGKENAVESDTTAPHIESYIFVSDSVLQIVFTEAVDEASATNPDNYELGARLDNNFAAPQLVRLQLNPANIVYAFFDEDFTADSDGEHFTLVIENQRDAFGNRSDGLIINIEIIAYDEADSGEVAINEFMYDPAEDFSEFVELFNPTTKNFNLQGWAISDNTGSRKTISQETLILPAGGFLVLAPDSSLNNLFQNAPLRVVSGFPTLNNSSDAIVLTNANGQTIDSLTYSANWGGEEVSLERRSVNFPATLSPNWGGSPSADLGTPGSPNQIEMDTEGPMLESVKILSESSLQLMFDEPILEATASDLTNFGLTNALSASPILFQPVEVNFLKPDTVTLTFDFVLFEQNVLEIRNQTDVFGNSSEVLGANVQFVPTAPVAANEVVINEILYRRADELSPEFVELFNRSESNFDMAGWSLTDAGNNTAHIPAGTYLKAGEYLVLTDREEFASTNEHVLYVPDFPSLNDAGDELSIKNADNLTIDSLYYQAEWGGDEPGVSLERKDAASASNDASNWATSFAESGNSATVQNSVFMEDVTPPEIIFSTRIDSAVKVVFSEFVQLTPATAFSVNEQESNILFFDENQPNELFLEWQPPILIENTSSKNSVNNQAIRIQHISDVKGNSIEEIAGIIALKLEDYPVVINEIMFDPLANSEDNLPDQTEYIELYNPYSTAVSLEGFYLHDAPDEDGEVREIAPVSTTYRWIPAQEFALIYAEDEEGEFAESHLAQYFGLETADERFALRVNRSSLSLGNSGDSIYLADSTEVTIDSVYFEESWQNPNLYNSHGIALELIDPSLENNQAANWSSSTHVSGGTPLAQNSIFQEAGVTPENVGIHFSPNPFSPDGDGFEDNLFINYTLDAPDYLLRVRIFDRYGREVRELVQGEAAGFEGSLIWDGLTDDDRRNRVGMYIVFFEAYDSSTGQDRTFKKTVVLARKFQLGRFCFHTE